MPHAVVQSAECFDDDGVSSLWSTVGSTREVHDAYSDSKYEDVVIVANCKY